MTESRVCAKCGMVQNPYGAPGLCANCMLQTGFDPEIVPSSVRDEGGLIGSAPVVGGLPPSPRSFGDYELLEEIARGGMGIIYRARQVSLNRLVAVKMLLAGSMSSTESVRRFRAEASAAASLQHPNIVAIHEVGVHQGLPYFAMDLVEGESLAKRLAAGPMAPKRAAGYVETIALAIHYAHERGLLHRDLKPSNVLIDPFDQPKITDFGLAKRLTGDSELTLTGQVLGSPNYMPPEQAGAKKGQFSRRSDIYALGSMLYHLLTGRPPFVGEAITDILAQVINSSPVPPRLLNPSVPRDLETICLKCLEKEPAKRYGTAQALAEDLSRFLRHEPIEARPVSAWEKMWRFCRRKPALTGLSAASAFLFLAVAIISPIAAIRIASERQRADQKTYDADMISAQRAWDDGDVGFSRNRLEEHLPRSGETDRRGFEWFYFRKLCEGDARITLTNHQEAVTSVAFSPDGRSVATGTAGDDDPVRIWDSVTGQIQKTLPRQNVISLSFSPDGRMLGVGGRDQIAIWNLETGQAIFKLNDIRGLYRLAFLPQGTLVVIGKHGTELGINDDGSSELWDYVTRERKRVFPNSGGYVAVSPNGDRLATGNSNDAVIIWDLATGTELTRMTPAHAIALAFSPDGKTLGTSDWGSAIKMWEVATGKIISSRQNNGHRVWSLAFTRDGKYLATGSTDQTVSLWDLAKDRQDDRFLGHGAEVMSVAFSSDGQTLVSGSRDQTAMIWNIHPHRTATTLTNFYSRPIFSRDGRFIAAGIGQNQVALWDVATLGQVTVFDGARDVVAFSSDGGTLTTRGTNYFLRDFNVATQSVLRTIPGRPAKPRDSYATLAPNGRILLTGSDEGQLIFSDARTGALIRRTAHAQGNRIFQIDFSPNGKLAVTAGREAETVRVPAAEVWDLASTKRVVSLLGHTKTVLSATFSPDGKTLATCGADNSIRFWETTHWKQILPPLLLKEFPRSLAFTPNGRTLAAACDDGTTKFWSVATHHELASSSVEFAMYIFFSPDGQTLALCSGGRTLHLLRAPRDR